MSPKNYTWKVQTKFQFYIAYSAKLWDEYESKRYVICFVLILSLTITVKKTFGIPIHYRRSVFRARRTWVSFYDQLRISLLKIDVFKLLFLTHAQTEIPCSKQIQMAVPYTVNLLTLIFIYMLRHAITNYQLKGCQKV